MRTIKIPNSPTFNVTTITDRVSIARLDRGELPTIQESIQSTVQRFTHSIPVSQADNDNNNNHNPQGYVASRIDQRKRLLSVAGIPKSLQRDSDDGDDDDEINEDDDEECDFSISSRRPPQIDAERIMLQHHLRGVTVSCIPSFVLSIGGFLSRISCPIIDTPAYPFFFF